jgi:hypothetical protein
MYAAVLLLPALPAAADQMYAVDLHAHSTVSADARADLGTDARSARAAGLNALFLTDHNQASDFSISTHTANNSFFDTPGHDDLTRWTTFGTGVSQVTSPVHSGTAATRIVTTSAEQGLWTIRGPNFRAGSGAVTTTFSLFPVSLGAGASVYVSASFGGDFTLQSSSPGPEGYTPAQSGVATKCKSVVLIWYFGAAPAASRYQPTSSVCGGTAPPVVVKAFPITAAQCDKAFTLNTWNTCTLDVDAAVATLAAADKPMDYLGLTNLKVAASGSANVYVDDYATKKALPAGSTIDSRAGAEFAARDALIPQYDDPAGNFRLFPSLEEGTSAHAQRFNFGITTADQYTTFCNGTCNYSTGISGIAPTQASGYPAQLNHPGVSGGVTDAQATGSCPNGLTPACGADVMEVRDRNMITDWDTILKAGTPLVGTFTTDDHSATWGTGSPIANLFSPTNSFDHLMQALFEGRAYNSLLGTSTTRTSMLFNTGNAASEPYPARYPLFVPSGDTLNLHVTVSHVRSGSFVRWVQNGVMGANENAPGGNYSATRSLTMTGSSAYARVEVGKSATVDDDASTQGIMLKPAASGVPSGMTYHVERVTPPSGQPAFTKTMTKGITASSWSAANQSLSLTLTNRVGSLVEVRIAAATAPQTVTENGSLITAAPSLGAFNASSGASWFYDGSTVYVKQPAARGTDSMVVAFAGGGGDTTPPTAPGTPTATSVGTTNATITWTAATDDVGVTRYDVSRDGTVVGSVTPPASGDPTFTDTGLSPSTTYSYVVTALDAAGNGTDSPPGSVTTAAAPDTTPPSKPVVSAAPSATAVTLTWPPATDNVGVARYDITRGTTVVGSVPQPASGNVTFTETGLTPTTAYSYVVTAFDAAGNSTASDAVPVTTLAGGAPGTTTLTAVADAKVDASTPSTNFATVALKVDASPDVRSYVKFNGTGIVGFVQSATLRIWATTAQTVGFDAYPVGDTSWTETGLTYANQPSASIGPKLGSSGAVAANTWKTIDVTPLVQGAAVYAVVLRTTSSTALSLASREDAAHAPQLVVTTTATAPDTTPPTAPGTPAATAVGSTTATISWARSSDDVGVTRYDVRRNGTVVDSVPQPASGDPTFSDSGLAASTGYTYVVTAFDAAGNHTDSPPGTVTTTAAPDTSPPTAPGTPAATSVGATNATISWTRSSDDVGVARYDVSRDGTVVGSVSQPASGDPTFSESGLTASTTYSYVVTAFDAAGNHTDSPPGSVTTAATADTTPPTAPGTPAATTVGSTSATISWTRSTDDVGVTRYDVSRDGTVVGSAPQPVSGDPTFSDSGLTASTTYSYVVTAFDAAGNHTDSPAGSVTTTAAPPDTTPPSKPVVSATPATTSVALAWPRAADDVAVTRYDITRGGTAVGTVPQPPSGSVAFTDTGLTPNTAYSYVVTAFDAAGNSTASDAVPVTTLATGGTTTLTAVADAKVDASTPTTNFATAALRVDASPDVRSYIKFNATGLTGTVQSATLRIWATSAQTTGFDAYPVGDSSWTETGLTSANQPSASIGAKLGSSGAVAAGTWKTIDVTAMVTGAGTYSVVLQTTSGTALALSSREDAAHAPQLVITTT